MSAAPSRPAVEVRELSVLLPDGSRILDSVSLDVQPGEILGLIGESGSGKSTLGRALLGMAPGLSTLGSIHVGGEPMLDRPEAAVRALRGRRIAYVPQDPPSALNPVMRVRAILAAMLPRGAAKGAEGAARIGTALRNVDLPADPAFLRRYPHQLSGGQQQRLAIAAAIVAEPEVLVFDEPTTGLDVLTQALVIGEVRKLRERTGVAIVYISHDLRVVAHLVDRVAVLYSGRIVEAGTPDQLIGSPRHPYTRGLVSAIPDHRRPRRLEGIRGVAPDVRERRVGCAFAPRCELATQECREAEPVLEPIGAGREVRCFHWREVRAAPAVVCWSEPAPVQETPLLQVEGLGVAYRGRAAPVLEGVSLTVARGERLAVVGQSGSGKTTLSRTIAGLEEPTAGSILLDGEPLPAKLGRRTREQLRRIQIVFQNPTQALNPHRAVGDTIFRTASVLRGVPKREAEATVARLMDLVRLPHALVSARPRDLSGGQRQRVAIAAALAADPELLICDEVTSALDVSVQAVVIELLCELSDELGLALVFVSHDLGVVASIASRTVVLADGRIDEAGPTSEVLSRPSGEFTRSLLSAAAALSEGIDDLSLPSDEGAP